MLQNNVTVDASAQRQSIKDQNRPNVSTSVVKPKPKATSTTTHTNTTTSYEPIQRLLLKDYMSSYSKILL